MREPPRWFDGLAVLGAVMIHAVLDKTYRQHQASARRYGGEALQHRIVDGANLVEAAAGRDQGDRSHFPLDRGRTASSDIGDVGQTCLQPWTSEIKERAHLQRHQRRPGVDEVDR
jgi:hypothetical protein